METPFLPQGTIILGLSPVNSISRQPHTFPPKKIFFGKKNEIYVWHPHLSDQSIRDPLYCKRLDSSPALTPVIYHRGPLCTMWYETCRIRVSETAGHKSQNGDFNCSGALETLLLHYRWHVQACMSLPPTGMIGSPAHPNSHSLPLTLPTCLDGTSIYCDYCLPEKDAVCKPTCARQH